MQGSFSPISPFLKKGLLYNLIQEGEKLGLNLKFKTLITQWKFYIAFFCPQDFSYHALKDTQNVKMVLSAMVQWLTEELDSVTEFMIGNMMV